MTPLLGAPLLVAVSCLALSAQDAKPPVTALEGEWREPLRPGEKATDRMVVTITGEEITLVVDGVVFRGTIEPDPSGPSRLVRFSIVSTNRKGPGAPHYGLCLRESDNLLLQVKPRDPSVVDKKGGHELQPAPVTFRLEKVQK
jgi:hypothetical protein